MYDQTTIDIFKDCFGGTQLKLFDEDDCMIPQYDIKDLDKIDGHEYVDLGLTSGLKRAACNIGAYWSSTPNDKSDDIQAYAMTFIVDEENAMHPSPECRFYGFNIRAVSE